MAALVEMVAAVAALVAGVGRGGAGDRRGRARADERPAALETMTRQRRR